MSQLTTPAANRTMSAPELALLAACMLAAVGVAIAGWYSALLIAPLVLWPLLVVAVYFTVGFTGFVVLAAAFVAFLLMNRIDEGLVLPIGTVALKASYWFIMLCAATLAVANLFRYVARGRTPGAPGGFTRYFSVCIAAFAIVMLAGAFLNQLYDTTVYMRDVSGEFVACISIIAPMLFVPLLIHAPITMRQLVLTMQAIIALGGLAGLVLAAFAFLPDNLIGALGWASANQGTVGLLRGRLPLGHPNAVAAVIILLMPPAIVLGLIPGARFFRACFLAAALFMFAGVLFSLARSALIVTTLVLGLTIGYIYFGRGRKTLMTYMLPVFFALGLGAVMTYLFLTFDFSRFWSRGYYEDATLDRRNVSLMTSLAVIKDHPVWGVTPDAVYTRLETRPGWEPPMEDTISPIYYYQAQMTAETPHNMYLTVLAETGVLGALCFFGAIGGIFFKLWRLRKAPNLSDEQRHAIMGFMFGLLGFLLMGAFESLLMVGMRSAYLFWVMAALALRYAFEVSAQPADPEEG
jgi:O-antigen ligase